MTEVGRLSKCGEVKYCMPSGPGIFQLPSRGRAPRLFDLIQIMRDYPRSRGLALLRLLCTGGSSVY